MSGSDSSGWLKSRIEVALRGLLRRIQGGEDASGQLRRLTTLHEVGRTISSTLEMDAVLDLVMTKAVEILDAEAGSLLLADRDGADVVSGDLVFRVVLGPAAQQLTGQRLPAGEGLAGKAFETGQGIIANDVRADDEWYDVPDTATGFRTRSVLAVPLVSRGRSIGVLEVVNKKGNALFDDEDLDLLATFATQAAIALENASLYERTDEALSKRLQEIATVEEIDHELGATLDYDRIINLVLQRAIEVCDAKSGLIGFLSRDGAKLGSLYWHGDQPEWVQELAGGGWPVDRGIVGRVVRSGEPTLVPDVLADPDYEPVVATTRSEIAVPITREERLIGVLNLESDRVAAFGHEDLRFLSHLAGHAGIAIENARLFQEERRRVQMLSAVGEITSEISAGLDLDRTLNLILARVKDLFDYYIAEICLWDEEQQLMVTFASAGDPRYTARTGGIYHLSEGFTGWIARNQEWLLVPDISQRTDVQPKVVAEEAPVRSYVGLPLKTGEAFIGTLELASDETGAYSEESVEILQIMADQAAVAIQNARLFEAQQRQVRELEILFETSAAISSSLELNEVLRTVGRKIATALNVTSCSISDWDRDRDVVRTLIDEDLVPHASPDDVGKIYSLQDYPTTAKVLRERVPQVVQLSDPDCDPQERALMEQLGYRSLLMMPMVARDRVVGLLELFEARRVRDFSDDDIRLCRALANQAAVAFENARLYERTDERLQARVDELMALQRITQELNATLALDGILEVVLDSAIRITRSTHGNVMLMDLDTGEFTLRVAQGYSDSERSAIEDTLLHLDKDNITHQVLESKEARVVEDAREETCTVCVRGDTRSALAIPIFYEGVVVGLIHLRHIQPAAFDQEDLAAVQALAEQASVAIGNALRFEEQVEANTALRRRSEQMDSLLAVGEKLRADVPLADTLEEIAYAIQETVGFNYVIISVVKGAPPMLHRLAAAGVPLAMLDEMREIVQPIDRYERILRPEYQQGLCYFFPFQRRADWEAELDTRLTMPELEGWQEGQWHPHDMLLAPLRGSGGRLLGYISVDEPRDGLRPSRQTLEVLAIFASQATIAVENANLYADAQRRADDLTLINEVGRTLTQVMEPKQVLGTVVKGVGLLLQCEQAAVFQQNRIDGRLYAVASYGVSLAEMARFSFAPGEGLVGHVAATGESLLLPDTSQDPRFVAGPVPIASMMLVPIKVGRHVIGVLTAGGPNKHGLTESDRILLTTLADQAAVALESARLFSSTQQAAVRLSLLNEIGRRAAARLELGEMLETTVEALHRNLGYYRVAVLLADEDKQELYVAAANEDFWPVIPPDYRLAVGQGLIGAAASSGETVLANDAFSDDRFHQVEEWGAPASLSVPIRIGNQVTGVLHSEAEEKGAFAEEDAASLEIAADQLAVAIENARLFAAEARRRREAETLQAATQALSTTLDLQEILEVILSELQEVVPYDSASVQYLERDQLRIIGGRGFPNLDELLGARLRLTEDDNPNLEVVRTRKPQIVDDAPVLYRAFREGPLAPAGIRSWMGIPLLFGDRLIGMLTLDKKEPGFYAEEHARLAMSFAVQAAVAIENARLFEAEARRRREAETLQAATRALSATLDLQEIFEEILRQLRQVVPYDSASVQQLEANELQIIGGDGFPNPDQVLGMRFDVTAEDNPNRIVVSTRKPYILDDAPVLYEGFAQGPHVQAAVRSWLGVPLLFGDRLIGMITLDKQEPGFYGEEHARLALAFAAQAAVAIQNARLFQQIQRRVAELATVNEVGRAISRALDAEQLLEMIYAHVSKLLDTRNFFVALYDDQEEQIRVEFLVENGEPQAPVSFPMGQGLTSHLVGSGKPILISDGTAKYQKTHGLIPVGPPAKSWLGVPMIAEDQVLGGIVIQNYEREGEFDEGHLNLLSTVAGQAAIALQNASLFQERERRIAELAVLNEMSQAISAALKLEDLLETVYQQVSRIFDTTNFFIATCEEGCSEWTLAFAVEYGERQRAAQYPIGAGLTGYIIRSRKPVLLKNEEENVTFHREKGIEHIGEKAKSWLGVPLIAAGQVFGVMAIQDYVEENLYGDQELSIFSTITAQVAVAMRNAQLYGQILNFTGELEARVEARTRDLAQALAELTLERDRAETLYRITSELGATLDLDRVLQYALRLFADALGVEHGTITLLNQETGYLDLKAALGPGKVVEKRSERTSLTRGVGLAGWTLEHREPVLVPDVAEDPRWTEIHEYDPGVRSVVAAPLSLGGGDIVGVLTLGHPDVAYFGEDHLQLVTAAASQIAIAVNNSDLYAYITEQADQLGSMLQTQRAEVAKNRAILESIADGVLVLDYNGRVLLVNPAAEELLGISAMVIEGEHYRHMLGLGETAAQRELAQQLYSELRTRLESAEDDPGRLKAGGVRLGTGNRVLAVNIAPLLTAVGETPGLVAALRDISREAEVERLKNEFISTVSHELRTPMTSIKGYTDLLFLGMVGGLTDAQRNFLQIIKSNADRLTALVNDILDISRIETGRIRLTIESLDLAGIIDDVVLAFREQYRDKELDLEWDPPKGLAHVRGDAARITQILNNLVANAWQYTPSGGRVTVSVQPLDGMLQVDVADTGIGISPDDMSRVFDRFYRVDDPVVEEAGGTGLGLSIVKMFVDMLGGEIWVESELGVGSTFSFTLPLATADLPDITPELLTTEAPTVMGRRQKILVIEDDHDLALLLRRQLEAEGYQVLLTGSGEDALWLAKEEKPQLITLDIMLPDLDGFVVLERLKAHPMTAPIPVIIVSVLSETDRGYALGAVDYVVKPFEEDKLLHSVREALSPSEEGQVQTVLVVDDDADIRRFLEEALSFHGYAVSTAANGEEALERVQEGVPDLILLDIKMPGVNGYEVIRRLKSKEDTWAIPIIVITASPVDKERDRVKVLGMGASRYLTKPLSIQTLIGEIKNAVAERQAE